MQGKKKIVSSRQSSTVQNIKIKEEAEKKLYFGPEVQQAMKDYLQETCQNSKTQIYQEKILPAFDKLVENLIFIYGFSKNIDNVEEVKADCICHLFDNMHKFNGEKGTKAFSYFNVVARNWLIINARRKQKYNFRNVSLDDPTSLSKLDQHTIMQNSILPAPDEIVTTAMRRESILEIMKKIDKRLTEPYEKATMTALNLVFENANDIDFLTKRAVFFYIREIAGVDKKKLSVAMTTIRSHYKDIVKEMGGTL